MVSSQLKQSAKDWKQVEEWETELKELTTREQVIEFNERFSKTCNSIGYRNEFTRPHISRMKGYISALLKTLI